MLSMNQERINRVAFMTFEAFKTFEAFLPIGLVIFEVCLSVK